MARKHLLLPEEKYFKDGPTAFATIAKFVIDLNALVELGPEEVAVKVGEVELSSLLEGQRLQGAKDAIDDLADEVQYAQQYVACVREAGYPDADLLSLDANLDSLSEQAAQYAGMSHGQLDPPPPAETPPPTSPPTEPVTPPSPSTLDQLSEAFKVLIVVATVLGLLAIFVYSRAHRTNNPASGGGGGTYTMYWACPAGQDQCVQGHDGVGSGVGGTSLSASACSALQQQWARTQSMQPGSPSSGGTWCAP